MDMTSENITYGMPEIPASIGYILFVQRPQTEAMRSFIQQTPSTLLILAESIPDQMTGHMPLTCNFSCCLAHSRGLPATSLNKDDHY
jgi:hypothetical protein